jgi:hypothetical protein
MSFTNKIWPDTTSTKNLESKKNMAVKMHLYLMCRNFSPNFAFAARFFFTNFYSYAVTFYPLSTGKIDATQSFFDAAFFFLANNLVISHHIR